MMYRQGHVIISLSDSEEDETDETSTCTSEVSDVTYNNTTVTALGKHAKNSDNLQRTKKKRRRKKKRKLKTSNGNVVRVKNESSGNQTKEFNSKASNSKVSENLDTTPNTRENTVQTPSDAKPPHAGSVVKRVHSAPAVISKRMGRKEYTPTKPLSSDNMEPKPGNTSQSQTTITDIFEHKARVPSDYAIHSHAFQANALSVHMERQKSVLNSLRNTIQRSLPPVLHTHTLSFANKSKQMQQGACVQPANGMPANTNISKVFLRYAQPNSIQNGPHKLQVRRTSNSARPSNVANYNAASLDPSQFKVGLPARNQLCSASQGHITLHEQVHVQSDTEKRECRPKSILRKDKTDLEKHVVSRRKSVRFNANDQITYM